MDDSERFGPPSFPRRCAAAWVDFLLLLCVYFVLGFVFRHVFDADAYPRPTGMQFYSERDFAVYWFFVRTTAAFIVVYMAGSYRLIGGTVGQRMAQIGRVASDGGPLGARRLTLRILVVLFKAFIVFFPGPIAALFVPGVECRASDACFLAAPSDGGSGVDDLCFGDPI